MVYCPGSHTQRTCSQPHGSRKYPTWVAMHGRCITLRHYGWAGSPLLRTCDHLNLAYSQDSICKHKSRLQLPGRCHVEASDWSSVREAIPVSDLGLLFSAVVRERHPGARTQCGQSPLHHIICLRLYCPYMMAGQIEYSLLTELC